jgi:two-component system, NtrC family, response regulator HydG
MSVETDPDSTTAPIIGRSPLIAGLKGLIRRIGPTEATVLIVGERGTGKELVADALHRLSRRRDGPYIKLDCGTLPRDLLASELFGHERGAFTGALERRPGLLAAASGGTVFLDEIGNLSLEGQAMLLRFLQDGHVKPVGARAPVAVDVRIIAATNKDLREAIARREFLADLYDRLSVVVLAVPPLRDRRQDIGLLVEHLVARQSQRHGVEIPRLSPSAWRQLQDHPWPGNVRELENAIARGVILAESGWIRPADFQLHAGGNGGSLGCPDGDHGMGSPHDLNRRQLEALRLAAAQGSVRRADLTTRFGISGEAARRDLAALVEGGFLQRQRRRGVCLYLPTDHPQA